MNDNLPFATELLHELKMQSRRWFIAFVIMIIVEAFTISAFLWYVSLPVEDSQITVENDAGNANYIGKDMYGVINNGEDNSTP